MGAKVLPLFVAPVLVLLMASGARAQSGPIEVVSLLSGGDVVPNGVLTGAFGIASLSINEETRDITFELQVLNLPSGLSGAHIHVGAPGLAGPVLYDLRPTQVRQAGDITMTGTLGVANLTTHADLGIRDVADALESIIGLAAYIDVHTDGHGDGEIRGLLMISMGDSAAAGVRRTLHPAPRTFR
jgi:hypothetical protein